MTTKKAYAAKNSHEAYNENEWTKLGKLIAKAWDVCEAIDYIPEWDEQSLDVIISAVAEVDPKLAQILEIEAIVVYGEEPVEVRRHCDWGYD